MAHLRRGPPFDWTQCDHELVISQSHVTRAVDKVAHAIDRLVSRPFLRFSRNARVMRIELVLERTRLRALPLYGGSQNLKKALPAS